jgi:hypothetical protein
MFYFVYEYLLWLGGYNSQETPTVEPKVESEPEPMVNIAQMETEQEIVEPVKKKKHKW